MKECKQYLENLIDKPEIQYWPEVRWWLAEGLNTDKTLKKNVEEIYKSGFGATEVVAMPEPGADSSIYGWGSEEWMSDTRLIIKEATKLGLGFSLTSGANWSNANLSNTYIWDGKCYSPDSKAASQELDYATIVLEPGENFEGKLPLPIKLNRAYKMHTFYRVVKAKIKKERSECGQNYNFAEGKGIGSLEFDSLEEITDLVKKKDELYTLNWTAPRDGKYALFVYWIHGTGQTAEPSASINYTINYVDRYGIEALIHYWEDVALDEELKQTIAENGRGQFYMDSLELSTYGAGGLFWGFHLREEFEKRIGYDITKFLPLLTIDGHRHEGNFHPEQIVRQDYIVDNFQQQEEVDKIQNDFFRVLSEMYLENVLCPLQTWLKSLGMTLRAEPSYGMTFEISTPGKYLDGVEVESFAQAADVELYRGLLGSANMYGRLFSSETGAVEGKNYYYNMDQWTQLALLQFSEGVNRTVFHGYSAIEGSEQDTQWPGHEGMYPMFAERFSSRQPASKDYKEWNSMLARNQKVLRQGKPLRDIAILRTDYFFAAYDKYHDDKELDLFPSNYMMNDMTYFWNDLTLQQSGYTYDYFSPRLLEDENVTWSKKELQSNGPGYQAIIIFQETLEYSSATKLLDIAKSGLPILFVNNNKERVRHGKEIQHHQAASRSKHYNNTDEEIKSVVSKIKSYSNVREVNSPENVIRVLQEMNICPRVQFVKPNNQILTTSRRDKSNNILYTFLYSYKFEKSRNNKRLKCEISVEGTGTPYILDTWTKKVEQIGAYRIENGRTYFSVSLIPGESIIIALHLGELESKHILKTTASKAVVNGEKVFLYSEEAGTFVTTTIDGCVIESKMSLPKPLNLEQWDISIEDWNEGEKIINKEEKYGHETTEVYFETNKTPIHFPNCKLKAWKDLPQPKEWRDNPGIETDSMKYVSGIGRYINNFILPEKWNEKYGAILTIENAGGGTVKILINGKEIPMINIRTLKIDITEYLNYNDKNTILIEVTSTLTNRMIQRGYVGWISGKPEIQSYGLQGKVQIIPYALVEV